MLFWGWRDQGCSWVSRHVAHAWQGQAPASRHVAVVDFRSFEPGTLETADACLQEVARIVAETWLDDSAAASEAWAKRGSAQTWLTSFMKDQVLTRPGEHLLVLDHANLVHSQPYYEDFAGLLRSWAEKARAFKPEPWDRLRLMVSVGTHPLWMRTARHASPFANLSEPIHVDDFEHEQVADLARRYHADWTDDDIRQLMHVAGGHPYLLCIVLVDTRDDRYTLAGLAGGAAIGPSLLRDYLRRRREHMDANPGPAQAFATLARDPAASVSPEVRDELLRQGLVMQAPDGTHPVRYPLYMRLLAP